MSSVTSLPGRTRRRRATRQQARNGHAPSTGETPAAQSAPEAVLVSPEEESGLLDEQWSRRQKVQTLRLRGFTQQQIASALSTDQSTVSRDLAWIRAHRDDVFGTTGKYDTSQELGEAVALFQDVEMSALRDYARLPTSNVKDRNACLRTAVFTRLSRLNVLQDAGFLERKIGTVGIQLRADAVRDTLIRDGLLLPAGSRLSEAFPDDPLDQWMRSEQ